MSCQAYEPLIALYVEGDLPGGDVARVQEHLAACVDCRELLDELQASQEELKQLRAEPVDAAFLAAVRSEVLEKIHARRKAWWQWPVTAAAVATAMALIAMLRPEPKAVKIAPTPELRMATSAPPPPMPSKPRAKRRPHKKTAAPPLVVKMFTDDPNIVIIWLVDQTGD